MEQIGSEKELFHACQVLFGPELKVSVEFLQYLQEQGIKNAYRKKAFETHPDLNANQGQLAQAQKAALFITIHQAYKDLSKYVLTQGNGFASPSRMQSCKSPSPQRPHFSERTNFSKADDQCRQKNGESSKGWKNGHNCLHKKVDFNSLFSGSIPCRKLLFGHYIYYSRIANWHTVARALIWQRINRPRVGEIGRSFGWLSDNKINQVIENRRFGQPFGFTAMEMGLLTESQLRLIINRQKNLQKKIGSFFVENNLVTASYIEQLATKHQQHNTHFEAKQFVTPSPVSQ